MTAVEILRFALHGLLANKLRSALTMLGIMIGVAAVILLVAVGQGSSEAITSNIARLGSNTLTITPSFGGGMRVVGGPGAGRSRAGGPRTQARQLTLADARALADPAAAPSVKTVSPVVTAASLTATYEGASHSIGRLVGTYPSYFEAANRPVAKGSYFINEDVLASRKLAVIGTTVAEALFGEADPVGKQITISGVPFTVAGVLKETGTQGVQDADDIVIAPLPAVQQSLTGFGGLDQIVVQAKNADVVADAEAEITVILNERHGITGNTAPDYRIQNQAALQETVSAAAGTFTVLLAAIAAISLVVGGIGITNIMLVTVTERTREIGIRKAIGATRGAILGQFLAEATMLSLAGGLAGVAVGVIGSRFPIAGIQPVIVPGSIVVALGVSVAIGLFFGVFPANRAAKLRPIEALRHD